MRVLSPLLRRLLAVAARLTGLAGLAGLAGLLREATRAGVLREPAGAGRTRCAGNTGLAVAGLLLLRGAVTGLRLAVGLLGAIGRGLAVGLLGAIGRGLAVGLLAEPGRLAAERGRGGVTETEIPPGLREVAEQTDEQYDDA